MDPRSQFHVWYEKHHVDPPVEQRLQYRDVGGFYRYFLDPFPDNLSIVRFEHMNRDLPGIVQPYFDEELPPIPHTNDSTPVVNIADWYSGEACRIVNERYEWTWKSGWYNQWVLS